MREANKTKVDETGERRRYYFNNDYGASVICTLHSYGGRDGLWELAMLKKRKSGVWGLCCTTPATDNFIGWIPDAMVDGLLEWIEGLPKEVEEWTDS